jgi:hypothetical protein
LQELPEPPGDLEKSTKGISRAQINPVLKRSDVKTLNWGRLGTTARRWQIVDVVFASPPVPFDKLANREGKNQSGIRHTLLLVMTGNVIGRNP